MALADHLLIQISDIHLTTEGMLFAGVHPRENLLAGLALIDEWSLEPDVLIFTGDLADKGESTCYEDLAEIIDGAAKNGTTVVYLPGNHDRLPEFNRHLLGQNSGPAPVNQVHWNDGLRIVSLDSVVPNEDFGLLTDETLGFLRDVLSTPAPDGTILALHHPPIPTPIEPMAHVMLRQPGLLANAIAGSDVRIVLCGHNHHEGLGTLATVPVWVSPSIAYRADVLSRAAFRPVLGSAFSRIDLSDAGPTVSVIHVPHSNSQT
jgi:Icc protein